MCYRSRYVYPRLPQIRRRSCCGKKSIRNAKVGVVCASGGHGIGRSHSFQPIYPIDTRDNEPRSPINVTTPSPAVPYTSDPL